MTYNVSTPLARWHAPTCKAVVCQQAVLVPSIRLLLTNGRTQFLSSKPLPRLH
jgi:hypothetical protein